MADTPWFPWAPRRRLALWPQPADVYLNWDSPWYRASGDMECEVCGLIYHDHPTPPFFAEIMPDGNPRCGTMIVTCLGKVVKT